MTDDNRKWCWSTNKDAETWYGPFDTREGALADVAANILAGTMIKEDGLVLSRCNFADPAEAAERWAETFDPLEDLNEHTDEELQDYQDGETYAWKNGATFAESAKRELAEAVAAWACKHVETRWFTADNDAMEVIR